MQQTVKTSWYPGHMARGFSVLKAEIKKAQALIEVLDARIPVSSRNRGIAALSSGKRRIVILNKSDLVPRSKLSQWEKKLSGEEGCVVIAANLSRDISAARKVVSVLEKMHASSAKKSHAGYNLSFFRVVILGIPNVGKSTLINRLIGRTRAKVGKSPGMTLGKQWISFGENFELLDMPGILEPDLDDPAVADKLSMTYAVTDRVIDPHLVAARLVMLLRSKIDENEPDKKYPLYSFVGECANGDEALVRLAGVFNLMTRDGAPDIYRTSCKLLNDYREGLLGKYILDDLDAAPREACAAAGNERGGKKAKDGLK